MVPHPPPQFDAVEHCPEHPVVITKTRRAWWTWALGWGLVRNEDVEETPCPLCVDTGTCWRWPDGAVGLLDLRAARAGTGEPPLCEGCFLEEYRHDPAVNDSVFYPEISYAAEENDEDALP